MIDNLVADIEAIAAGNSFEGSPAQENHDDSWTKARLKSYAEPLSLERMIGAGLFVVALTKTIAVFKAASTYPAIKVTCIIALSYAFSFLIFEILVWSLALVNPSYSLEDIPTNSLLEILRFVDPGNNPFTFPSSPNFSDQRTSNSIIELAPISAHAENSTTASQSSNRDIVEASPTNIPLNKAVALSVASLGIVGPFLWVFLLSNIWRPSKSAFFLAISALAFLGLRLVGKVATRMSRLSFEQQILGTFPQRILQLGSKASSLASKLKQRLHTDPRLFLIRWLWERITTVNLFSAVWVIVICIFYAHLFPENSLEGLDGPPAKPLWLDWLG
jgi:hypothetical protein